MDALFYGDISALVAGFLVGEKGIIIDVEVSEMRMDYAEMRVNASEGFLQSAVKVGAAREVLRSSGRLIAHETRSNLSSLRSLARVVWACLVASVPSTMRSLEAAKSRLGRAGVVMLELLSWISTEIWTVLVSHSE